MIQMRYDGVYPLEESDFREQITKALAAGREFAESFVHLDENPIGSVAGMIGRLNRDSILGTQQMGQVMRTIATLSEEASEFDLVNTLTQMQHRNPNDLAWLEIGGRTIDYMHTAHCHSCGTHLN
jgi:hypothetical protein